MAQFPDLYICKGVISRSDGGLGITCVVFARGLVRDHPTPSPYKKTNGVVVGIRKKTTCLLSYTDPNSKRQKYIRLKILTLNLAVALY